MIYGITYCDEKMTKAAELCKLSMYRNGIDFSEILDKREFGNHDSFGLFNYHVLELERGCGYWLWKPYIIAKFLHGVCNDGDILIYADAGVEFINPVSEIINRMDEDIFFFTNGFKHVEWCKADCMMAINFSDDTCLESWYSEQKQVQASVILFKVNQKTRDFVKEWLLYCQMPGFIDDTPSKLPNYPTFAEHRHDQSVLTCLAIKYGYKLHFWSTKYSEHIRHTARPEDNYPTMFNHHRKRNNEW